MKKICVLIGLMVSYIASSGQTNTFPADGNVGVGTISPAYKLDVLGSFRFGGSGGYSSMLMGVESTPLSGYNQTNYMLPLTVPGSGTARTAFWFKNNLYEAGQNVLDVIVDGHVGIGTSSPENKLTVRAANAMIDVQSTEDNQQIGLWMRFRDSSSSGAKMYYGTADAVTYLDNLYTNTSNQPYGSFNIRSKDDQNSLVSRLYIQGNSGNVGIGTSSPENKLTVRAANAMIDVQSTEDNQQIGLWMRLRDSSFSGAKMYYGTADAVTYLDNLYTNTSNQPYGSFNIRSKDDQNSLVSRLYIQGNSGNVGIGTSSPNEKLAVNGKIRAKEIKVENTNWPDYVFLPSYKVPSLQETEKHIKEKGHLPGIPSASEVKANGVDLGDMNAKLLQKIEELTLHLIEQNKMLQAQQEEIKSLKSGMKTKLK